MTEYTLERVLSEAKDWVAVFIVAMAIVALFIKIALLLQIALSALVGFAVIFIAEDMLEKSFERIGLKEYWRTITLLSFILVGLWNWIVLVLLAIIILSLYIISKTNISK